MFGLPSLSCAITPSAHLAAQSRFCRELHTHADRCSTILLFHGWDVEGILFVESTAFFCSAPVGALTFLMQQLQMFTSISNLLLDILTYFAWNLTFLFIENVLFIPVELENPAWMHCS